MASASAGSSRRRNQRLLSPGPTWSNRPSAASELCSENACTWGLISLGSSSSLTSTPVSTGWPRISINASAMFRWPTWRSASKSRRSQRFSKEANSLDWASRPGRQAAAALPGLLAQTSEFASFENRWLLRDLLADLHVGHLNIAEALIEMRGQPVETGVLVKELELPKEIKPQVQAFSLQSSLAADGRFDQVGPGESRRWFLRRLEPAEALAIPETLRYIAMPYERNAISVELLQIEWELDDEWTEESQAGAAPRANIPSTTILLTYPHLISGTLPVSSHSRSFFPTGHGERTMVTLIDGRWGQRFPGWVVRGGRYVAGLRPWFDEHKLPAGAFIVLERKEDPTEVVVDFRPKRMRREWARICLLYTSDAADEQRGVDL